MSDAKVIPIDRLECTVGPWSWSFTRDRRAEIDAFFAEQQRENPALWNGRLLLLNDMAIADRVMRASFFETDYASLIAGITWGSSVKRCWQALPMPPCSRPISVFVAGLMASYTRNAGMICFASGSPEPADVVDSRVDLRRQRAPRARGRDRPCRRYGLIGTQTGTVCGRISDFLCSRLRGPRKNAATLRERILANLATQREPEFTDVYLRAKRRRHPAGDASLDEGVSQIFLAPSSILTPVRSAGANAVASSTVGVPYKPAAATTVSMTSQASGSASP